MRCVLLYGLLVLPSACAESALRQVHVVTRHGARFPLVKQATTLQEGTPGTLTPTGERQMYDLGVWLKQRYADFLPSFHVPSKIRIESSSFDRTIVSANSLALGLFSTQSSRDPAGESTLPGGLLPANVPVYSTERRNDIKIRAFANCDVLLESLQLLYESPEWKDLETTHHDLLETMGTIPSFATYTDESGKVTLENVWNVFDSVLVAKTECTNSGTGEQSSTCAMLEDSLSKNDISDSDWEELQKLAHITESMKYTGDAGKLIGSNLLLQIQKRMEERNTSVGQEGGSESFYIYSAHYPTLLGLFASLEENPSLGEIIPSYASALVFELFEDQADGSKTIKLFYRTREGLDVEDSYAIHGFDKVCPLNQECPLETIFQRPWSEIEWCFFCRNQEADVCLAYYLEEARASCSSDSCRPALAGILGGVAIGAATVLLFNLWRRRRYASPGTNDNTQGLEPVPPKESSSQSTII